MISLTTVRAKAKELTALLQDDERLRTERANRSTMTERLNSGRRNNGLGSPVGTTHPQRRRNTNTRRGDDENDDDMRRAIEESKRQADEDEKKRNAGVGEDDDIARELKVTREEGDLEKLRINNR